ncbi:MAG: hypothetical protein EOP19_21175 [Hyphomicrobiales bacterium]|nr:MAG: hypothetical protein EOP19_21175 [Hyphomicrobiales bacterium]
MADHNPSAGDADSSGGLWPAIKKLFDLDGGERTLREQLEETLDEAEQDASDGEGQGGEGGDLNSTERQMSDLPG